MASLTNVLEWLTQPKGPHLVDGMSTMDSLTAMALLVSPKALYDPDSPRVGLGLVYKAPYIQAASWSEAYFSLKLASLAKVSNQTTGTRIIFVQIQESSQVIPLPGVPTLFLDIKTAKEVTDSKVPQSPQDFRGFQLHQVAYTGVSPPIGQVAIPHIQGQTVFHWAHKQNEVLMPELEEAPQLMVALSAADANHWNIVNDPIFPSCLEAFKVRHEASLASGIARLAGGSSSQGESSTPTQELPLTTWPQPPPTPTLGWQEVDKKVAEVLDQAHNLQLETVQEMGFIREIDQALSKSLMVEFLRLQLIIRDDLNASLWTWQADMETATEEFWRDVDAASRTSTALPSQDAAVETALHKYREVAQLRLALPLTHLDVAQEEIRKFIQFHLEELQSQQETKNLVGELSAKITDHRSRVRQLLRSEPLRHPEVILLVLVGMAVDQPLESNFFPSLLEGLLGSLGIDAPGEGNPPASSQEGAGRLWLLAMCGAISQVEPREVETSGTMGLPRSLDLWYEEDFLGRQSHQIPPIFSDPLFVPNMAKAVYKVVKPPVVLKVLPSTGSRKVPTTSDQPEGSGPKLEVSEPEESTPSFSQLCHQVQELVSEASNTDSDKTDETTPEEEQPPQSLKVKLPLKLLKHGSKATSSSSKDGATPSKVRKESEANETEATASAGPSEAALWQAQFELYKKDLPEVQEVRAQILGLDEGKEVTQEALDSSSTFQLRWVANETRPPTVIGVHWIDHLDSEGRIAKCKPHDFKFEGEWLPLYTQAGVTKQVSGFSSLLNTQGDSPLIAVIPPDMSFQFEWEIHQLHEADCLARVSIYYGENQQKQIAFYPYCGVMNKNSVTAYSHARKHLGITFLCGGCYGKLYKAPQHLCHHMKSCRPYIMNRPEGSR